MKRSLRWANGCRDHTTFQRPEEAPAACWDQGTSLTGDWFDRTREFAARRRGEAYDRLRYATEETLTFTPLPCWSHLSPEQYRRRVLSLVAEIEEEAVLSRNRTGARPSVGRPY